MARLTLDEAREALPPLDELRPVFDHLLVRSQPDPARTWAGSGRLGTLGTRLVSGSSVAAVAGRLASEHAAALADIYAIVARVLEALERDDHPAAARALLEAASLEEKRDRPDRADAYAGSAYRAARDGKHDATTALALRRWARAARSLGMLEEAFDRYAHAYEIARATSDEGAAAAAAVGAGNVLEDQGRWDEAATWYQRALEAAETEDDPLPDRWYAVLNLHIVARSRGAIDESRSYLERAEEAAPHSRVEDSVPLLENARGQLSMALEDFAAAEKHLRSALEAATATHTRARVTIRLNLAEALLARGRILDAAEQARTAEQEAIRAGLVPKLPEVYRVLGRIASADGEPDAFVLFERALELVRDRALPPLEEAMTLQAYAEHEERKGARDVATALRQDAARRFEALGISHMRQAWADVFAPAPDSPPLHSQKET